MHTIITINPTIPSGIIGNKEKENCMIPNEINIVLKDIWPMLLLFIIVVCTMRVIDIIINNKKINFSILPIATRNFFIPWKV